MHHTTFSIQEAFESAWEVLKKKFELLAGSLAFMVILSWGFSFMKCIVDPVYYVPKAFGTMHVDGNVFYNSHDGQGFGRGEMWSHDFTPMVAQHYSFINILMGLVVSLIGCIVITLLAVGVTKLYFKVVRHEQVHFREVLNGEDRFFPFVIASIISMAAIVLGFIFFIIPGIYIALRLSLVKLYVVDRHIGPLEAIAHSWHATKGQAWQLFGFLLVALFINFLGALAFGVGLLVTIPLTFVAFIDIYEKLSHRHQTAA